MALDGGRVHAALGGGVLTSTGASELNATSAATVLSVDGGTLTLGAAQRLSGLPAVTLAAGGSLTLAGDETLGSLAGAGTLALNGGVLRTGSAGDSSYAGSLVGAGSLVKQGGGVFTLAGANAYSGSTTVEAGTLSLAAAERLPDTTAVAVRPGATLALAAGETVASLALAGTLTGSGTLTAASYALDGGDAIASLGMGTLSTAGNSRLAGTSAAGTVQVNAGTLTLASAERLADTAALSVAGGAVLTLNGDERVGSLALAGTVNGTGTLSAGTYSLSGGTVVADLGSGELRSAGNSRLDGRSAASTLAVDGGTLTLGAADRLADSMVVSVASGATLLIGATDTVASFTLGGHLGRRWHALSAGHAAGRRACRCPTRRRCPHLPAAAAPWRAPPRPAACAWNRAPWRWPRRSACWPRRPCWWMPAARWPSPATRPSAACRARPVELASFTLSTGSGGDSSFAGVISGSGGLIKQGSSSVFTLTGANSYTGLTQVAAGTLSVGDGGSLATSGYELSGTLRLARSDTHTLAQPVSGSGGIEQAGTGRLILSGNNKSYTGTPPSRAASWPRPAPMSCPTTAACACSPPAA